MGKWGLAVLGEDVPILDVEATVLALAGGAPGAQPHESAGDVEQFASFTLVEPYGADEVDRCVELQTPVFEQRSDETARRAIREASTTDLHFPILFGDELTGLRVEHREELLIDFDRVKDDGFARGLGHVGQTLEVDFPSGCHETCHEDGGGEADLTVRILVLSIDALGGHIAKRSLLVLGGLVAADQQVHDVFASEGVMEHAGLATQQGDLHVETLDLSFRGRVGALLRGF